MESWRNCTVPKGFEMCAQGCRVQWVTLCELRGRAVWERQQETLLGQGRLWELQLHFSFSLCPWSLPELSAALPTPAHNSHWFWTPAWPQVCSIPMSGATVPSPAPLATSGQQDGAAERAPSSDLPCCPPDTRPYSAVARPFLPIAKALLEWRGSQDSCITNPHNWFYSLFHCRHNSLWKSKRKTIFVTISLATGMAAALWVCGIFEAWFCKYLHICVSYKGSKFMDVRIRVWVHIYICVLIFAGSGPYSMENISPEWSQANLCQYFELILLDGRWRQALITLIFLLDLIWQNS